MIVKQLSLVAQKGKVKMKLIKKILLTKLETAVEIRKQTVEDKKVYQKWIRTEQGWYSNCKRIRYQKSTGRFDEVKEEEPINVENFFIDDNNIFLMQIGNLLLILLTKWILLPMLKDSLKNQMRQKWKLFIPRKKKWEERTNVDSWWWKDRKCEC